MSLEVDCMKQERGDDWDGKPTGSYTKQGNVKEDLELKTEDGFYVEEESLGDLYADHVVKDELVLGPERPHRPTGGLVVQGWALGDADGCPQALRTRNGAQFVPRDCSVKLERLLHLEAMMSPHTAPQEPALQQDTPTTQTNSESEVVLKKEACSICGMKFTLTSDLKEHVMTHIFIPTPELEYDTESETYSDPSDENGYVCDMCRETYTLKSNLMKHVAIHIYMPIIGKDSEYESTKQAEVPPDGKRPSSPMDLSNIEGNTYASPIIENSEHIESTTVDNPEYTLFEEPHIPQRSDHSNFMAQDSSVETSLDKTSNENDSAPQNTNTSHQDTVESNQAILDEHFGSQVSKAVTQDSRIEDTTVNEIQAPTIENGNEPLKINTKIQDTADTSCPLEEPHNQVLESNILAGESSIIDMIDGITNETTDAQIGIEPRKTTSNLQNTSRNHSLLKESQVSDQCDFTAQNSGVDTIVEKTTNQSSDGVNETEPRLETNSNANQDIAKTRVYICDVCGFSFKRKCHLADHIERHMQKTNTLPNKSKSRYVCEVCTKTFNYSNNFMRHKRTHTDEKPYCCDICKKTFSEKLYIKRHIHKVHINKRVPQEKHFCETCNKGFMTVRSLSLHKRSHSGEKPYFCDICKKGFSYLSVLYGHKRIHTGEKPYTCITCLKKFRKQTDLLRHQRFHSGMKPHFCDICEKRFSQLAHLMEHMRIHTGEKPYVCKICKKEFRQSSTFKRHFKRTHAGEVPYS